MANWAGGVLTAAGRRLQAKVEAGATLALTRIKLGSGQETIEETDGLIDLVAMEKEIPIGAATVSGEICTVTGILHASTLSHGFYCREWGVFANDPDDGEILYMITVDDQPDWIPASADTDISVTYAMNIAVANATNITANINLAGLVDVEMLDAATHAVQRGKQYDEGQLTTHPTLASGLILQCAAGGVTAETLIDWTQFKLGDTVEDGEVTWNVVRYQVTDGTDRTWQQMVAREDWLCQMLRSLASIVKRISQTAPKAISAVLSSAQPDGNVAWFKVPGNVPETPIKSMQFKLRGGSMVDAPLVRIKQKDGTAIDIDISGEISAAMNALENMEETFPPVSGNSGENYPSIFASDEDVQSVIDEYLPLPNNGGANKSETADSGAGEGETSGDGADLDDETEEAAAGFGEDDSGD